MLILNITDLNQYNYKSLYEYLLLQRETEFQILIPRTAITGDSDNYDVFEEYLTAAYAGQRLSEIAKCFAYYVPCLHSKQPFLFEATITDIGKLTEALYIIVHSVNKNMPSEIFLAFHSLAADFLTNVFSDRAECNTWGLLHIANHYLEK